MKKKILISILSFFILIGLVIGYKALNMLRFIKAKDRNVSMVNFDKYITDEYDNNNVPEYAKQFMEELPPKDYSAKNNEPKRFEGFSGYKNCYNKSEYDEAIKSLREIPVKNIDKYKSQFVANVKQRVGKCEIFDKALSFEDSEKLSFRPRFRIIRDSAREWVRASLYFLENNDPESALLTAYAILDVSHYLNLNGNRTYDCMNSNVDSAITGIAFSPIILAASKSMPNSTELTKAMAKDILIMANNIDKHSGFHSLKYEAYKLEKAINIAGYEDKINVFKNLYESSAFKNTLNEYRSIVDKYADKPYKEIKEDFRNDIDRFLRSCDNSKPLLVFWDPAQSLTNLYCAMILQGFKIVDISMRRLVMLEFMAVSLVINSYVSANNKFPLSLSEVEEYFGESLPKNRLTDDSFEFMTDNQGLTLKAAIDGNSELIYIFDRNDIK